MNRSRKLNYVRSFGKYKELQIQENIKRIVAMNNVKVESVEYVDLSDVIKELRE